MERGALTFGDRLRTEREKRSVSLDEVSASTRIRRGYLEALERNEFGELPGAVFNRGFVRAYADYLGLDPDLLLRAYARELRVRSPGGAEDEPAPLDELRRVIEQQIASRRSPRSRTPILAGAVVLVAAGAVGAWLALSTPGDSRPVDSRPATGARTTEPHSDSSREIALAAVSPGASSPSAAASVPVDSAGSAAEPASPSGSADVESPVLEAPVSPAASATPAPAAMPSMVVEESGVGRDVVDRVLVGRGERFEAGREVCFWTRVVGGRPGDQIRHVWLHEDRIARIVELPIDGSHWRTYSRHELPSHLTGRWTVEARGMSGAVLARAEFTSAAPR